MTITTQCNNCTKFAEGEGDLLTFEGFCGFLKGQGWWISGNIILCPKCRVYAEKNLLKEILGD